MRKETVKKVGIIATLSAMLNGLMGKPGTDQQIIDVSYRKNYLLTNGYAAPIPNKFLNQKQKRKLNRQVGRFK